MGLNGSQTRRSASSSGFHSTGDMKKASWSRLPTMGGMSRKRAQTMPSTIARAKALVATSSRPTSDSSASGPGTCPNTRNTRNASGRLCAATAALRNTQRSA